MAVWTQSKITDAGRALMADALSRGVVINFTNCKTSSHNYTGATLESLTDLQDIQQTKVISEKVVVDNTRVKLGTNITNTGLVTQYNLYAYGIYANDGGSDVLYCVSICETPDVVPSVSQATWQALIYDIVVVNDATQTTITINPSADATQQYVNDQDAITLSSAKTYADTKAGAVQTNLNTHTSNTSNPHSVTKAQVGLGNVVNAGQTSTPTSASTLYFTAGGAYSHTSNTSNPHSVTKAQVGLGNVANVNLGSVVNTGDSATPTSGGTTKFTTGGAYTYLPTIYVGSSTTRLDFHRGVWINNGTTAPTSLTSGYTYETYS